MWFVKTDLLLYNIMENYKKHRFIIKINFQILKPINEAKSCYKERMP
jgi:hypothetical protein